MKKQTLATFALSLALPLATLAQSYNYPPQQPAYPDQNQPYGDPNQQGDQQADPPSRVARISVVQGNVSLQPASVQDFSPASMNYPLTSGDRLYTDNGAQAELEAGQLALRLGGGTDLTVTSMTDALEQFGLAQGSLHVRSYDLDPNATLEVDTPNVAVTVLGRGDLRIDVSPDGNVTTVTLLSGQARVDGDGFQQMLQPGSPLQLTGSGPISARGIRQARQDGLDRFSSDRDNMYQASISAESSYVSPDTIGAADLGNYGDWQQNGEYGAVWYPRGVAADWQPYTYGRWAYVAPWGWTWVGNEPWGFAPFHYGRWSRFGSRWGWVPGPPVVRPVYSPALVVFVGGTNLGVSAWFPLGPREPFVPWYRSSPWYVNRVNISNIYNRNYTEVRNVYNQRRINYFNDNRFPGGRGYVNRPLATVAMPREAFASGRPVPGVGGRFNAGRLADAPVLRHPDAAPTRAIMAPERARALPPRAQPIVVQRDTSGPSWGGNRGGNGQQGGNFGGSPNRGGWSRQDPRQGGGINTQQPAGRPTQGAGFGNNPGQNPVQNPGQPSYQGGQPGQGTPVQGGQRPWGGGSDARSGAHPYGGDRGTQTGAQPSTQQPNTQQPSVQQPGAPPSRQFPFNRGGQQPGTAQPNGQAYPSPSGQGAPVQNQPSRPQQPNPSQQPVGPQPGPRQWQGVQPAGQPVQGQPSPRPWQQNQPGTQPGNQPGNQPTGGQPVQAQPSRPWQSQQPVQQQPAAPQTAPRQWQQVQPSGQPVQAQPSPRSWQNQPAAQPSTAQPPATQPQQNQPSGRQFPFNRGGQSPAPVQSTPQPAPVQSQPAPRQWQAPANQPAPSRPTQPASQPALAPSNPTPRPAPPAGSQPQGGAMGNHHQDAPHPQR